MQLRISVFASRESPEAPVTLPESSSVTKMISLASINGWRCAVLIRKLFVQIIHIRKHERVISYLLGE